jgi:hypothetical protein
MRRAPKPLLPAVGDLEEQARHRPLGRREGWEPPVIGEKEEARTPRHWISSEEDRVVGAGGEEDAGGRVAGELRRCISNGEEGPRELRPRALAELALPGEEEPVASSAAARRR